MKLLEHYVQYMITECGAPSRYAVYLQLMQLIGAVSIVSVLAWILYEQMTWRAR